MSGVHMQQRRRLHFSEAGINLIKIRGLGSKVIFIRPETQGRKCRKIPL
jgi:hypothetical protein